MVGRKKSYQIELDNKQRKFLSEVVAARKSPHGEVQRAKIVLTYADHPDWSDLQVAAEIGCSEGQVRTWRKRWCQTHSLNEAPRSGRPGVFSPSSAGADDRLGL
jgi:hypothetical protein